MTPVVTGRRFARRFHERRVDQQRLFSLSPPLKRLIELGKRTPSSSRSFSTADRFSSSSNNKTNFRRRTTRSAFSTCRSQSKSFVVPNANSRFITPKKCQRRGKNGTKLVSNAVRRGRIDRSIDQSFVRIEGLCRKMLESTTLAEHGDELFCKQCYARKFVRPIVVFAE